MARPLEALASLAADHPYALLGRDRVAAATRWLAERLPALDLRGSAAENLLLATALGAARPTAIAPAAIAAGDLRRGGPVVFAGVRALKDFVPALVAANVAAADGVVGRDARRPRRRSTCAARPTSRRSGSPARSSSPTSAPGSRAALRSAIGAADGARVGLPAVLGVDRHAEVAAAVSDALGGEVFEVPTAPPSVPGHPPLPRAHRPSCAPGGRASSSARRRSARCATAAA